MINCIFCNTKEGILYEAETAFVVFDIHPVTKYHVLVIPKRHVESYFDMTHSEHMDCTNLIIAVQTILSKLDDTITGFNVGVNVGVDAGQTVYHCHIHLIPRRTGDTVNPRGGVRGIIPGKADWKT